jgi:hypothetical protein
VAFIPARDQAEANYKRELFEHFVSCEADQQAGDDTKAFAAMADDNVVVLSRQEIAL